MKSLGTFEAVFIRKITTDRDLCRGSCHPTAIIGFSVHDDGFSCGIVSVVPPMIDSAVLCDNNNDL